MEYDRNQNAYGPSSPAGDAKYFSFDKNQIVPGFMSDTNKAEVDCLLCHLSDGGVSGAGRAWLKSVGCGPSNPIGPINDPTCVLGINPDGSAVKDGTYGLVGAGMFTPGTKYDPLNRNMAIRSQSFQYAASLGIGATVSSWGTALGGGLDGNYRQITGITGVPSTISAANIQATPSSKNCSACHARDDETSGTPNMLSTVRFGYGNVFVIMPAGTATEKNAAVADANGKNKVGWIELGCKTGMGKRGQRIGQGPNDKWGMSMFNAMFGLGKKSGDPVKTEKLAVNNPMMQMMGITSVSTKERIPDYDVHDKAGMQCATCHYAIGSKNLTGVATNEGFILSSNGTVTIPAGTNLHGLNTASGETGQFGVNYPEETIFGIDHQFAQGDDLKDTYGKNNLDGTVSCESCHIERNHPKYFSAPDVPRTDVAKIPPVPTHANFPAFHLDKISCTTCHIPEVYVAPFRLKSRDWTTGLFKKGNETNGAFKNIYDWEYDLVTGSHAPIKPIYQWSAKYEKKKITPVFASEMPIWVKLDASAISSKGSDTNPPASVDDTSAIKTCSYGSRIFAQCNSDADCPGGICWSGLTTYAAPAVTRAVMDAAISLDTAGTPTAPLLRRYGGNLNGAQLVPLFDGWPLTDAIGVDTAARIDAMSKEGAGDLLKIFHANFDVTHGIVPKEWALGGSKRGGCISCHSSAQPSSPKYSSKSVGFFEGSQHGIPAWAGVGNYDLMKNPFNLYADWDCTAYCGMGVKGDSDLFDPAGNIISGAACGAGSPFQTIDQCAGYMQQNFDATMGLPAGTAAIMGLNDGVSALQGFMLRETVSATALGCNPFLGAESIASQMGFQANVNNCMPANNPMFTMGACVGATQQMPGQCDSNSFRYKGMCFMNSDCNGRQWAAAEYAQNPSGLLLQRSEIRARHKLQMQQGKHLGFESVSPDGVNQLWWPILTEQNPSNPNHKWGWDQAGAPNVCGAFQNEPCCSDPMTGQPASCSEGMNVRTAIHGNQLLGYTADNFSKLTDPKTAGVPMPVAAFFGMSDASVSNKVNFDASGTTCPSGACSYSWSFGGTGSSDLANNVKPTFIYDAAGAHTVTLTVNDTVYGLSSSTSTDVTAKVLNVAPTASAVLSVSGMTVTVADSSTDDQPGLKVTVTWGDGTTTTQDAGTTFTHLYTAAGTYTVTHMAMDAGGTSASADLSPSDSTTLNAKVTVPIKFSVSGSLTRADGTTPLAGVAVYLKQGTSTKYIGSTNTSGTYTINNVAGGTYDVVPVKAGYMFTPASQSVTVGPNASGINFKSNL